MKYQFVIDQVKPEDLDEFLHRMETLRDVMEFQFRYKQNGRVSSPLLPVPPQKLVEIQSTDNKFRDWSAEQLWDHFITQVVGLYYINNQEHWHTWLRMIHRSDVIPGHHAITQSDGTIQAYRKNPKNSPELERRIMQRWQRHQDIQAGRE